jgi:hypothetical protein
MAAGILPVSWRPELSRLLPVDPANYWGPAIARWTTAIYLVATTVRSLIHLFAADGGAQSIATIDTAGSGGSNIIAIFGQWGAIQLLLAGLLWVLFLRYRGLLPLVILTLLLEPLLRQLSGQLKPVATIGTAPGAAFNLAVVPLLLALLYLALCRADRQAHQAPAETELSTK